MSTPGRRRPRPMLAAGIITLVAATGITGPAQAATSHRLPSTHRTSRKPHRRGRPRPKPAKPLTNAQILALIKKNEKPGPQGPGGPTGPAGASAGYAAIGAGGPVGTSPTTVVSKSLPAGNFLVNAKVVLSATAANNNSPALAECDLISSSFSTKLDSAQWDQPLSSVAPSAWAAATALPTQAAISLTTPATLSLQCYSSSSGSVALTASFASLQAAQVATAG